MPPDRSRADAGVLGLVGCGTVGRRIGARLLARGRSLLVHDHTEANARPLLDAGARWAASPAALGEGADFLISALPGPAELEAVVLPPDGLWSAAKPRVIHADLSTVGPSCVLRLGDEAKRRRIRLLDCPLSRGGATERGAELVLWVGGHVDHFDLARPTLEELADRVLYCGALGQGQVTKLVNNLVTHALTVILGEALVLGVRSGGSVDLLRAALHEGTGQTRLLDELLPASVFRGDWQPGLKMTLAEKDLRLAAELAGEAGVTITAIEALREIYRRGIERGWGDLTMYAVVRLAEEEAGVELRSPFFNPP